MKQIKIENNGIEQLITVPENSKVTIDGNVIVFEPKFKKGDCVIGKDSNYPKRAKFVEFVKDECGCRYDNNLNGCHFRYLRLATIEEKNETLSDLKAEGKQWNAEKLCIEDLKVVPKVGDYFKSSSNIIAKCCELDKGGNPKCTTVFISDGKLNTFYSNITCLKHSNTFKILTESEYAKEYAQLGFEYNFENDTISELKWKPKIGELFYYFDDELDLCSDAYNPLGYSLTVKCGNYFKTSELCQQAIDKIKQVLSEK